MANKGNQNQESVKMLFQQATSCFQQGHVEEAAELTQKILKLSPDHAGTNHLLGLIEGMRGNFERACRLIGAAINEKPDDPIYYCSLGLAQQKAGHLSAALASYERAIEIQPDYATAHYNRSIMLRDLGDLEKAITSFEHTIRLIPGKADIYLDFGYALKLAGRLIAALHAYEQATRLKPDNPEAHYNHGVILASLGRPKAALAAYEHAIRLKPDYAEAHNNRGTILKDMGRLKEAASAYKKTIELRPDVSEVYLNLAFVLKELGRNTETSNILKRALGINPELESARYMLASLGEDQIPAQTPKNFVKNLFDDYAEKFDDHLLNKLDYETPRHLFEIVSKHINLAIKIDILDIGCGTGLCGVEFSEIANRMIGIDLSPQMLAKAQERGIYTDLIEDDVTAGLSQLNQKFNLVISGDVFVYIGDLREVFPLVVRCLKQDGQFAFSIELNEGDQDYVLRNTGRYAHSTAYINRLAKLNGLEETSSELTVLRYDKGLPIEGEIFLLRTTR